jgi:hypothetical protein
MAASLRGIVRVAALQRFEQLEAKALLFGPPLVGAIVNLQAEQQDDR